MACSIGRFAWRAVEIGRGEGGEYSEVNISIGYFVEYKIFEHQSSYVITMLRIVG